MQMKQQSLQSPGVITFNDVTIPEVKENEVLAKIMRRRFCGIDISTLQIVLRG